MADDPIHVIFPLEVDDDGWPPVGSERVWATPLGDHQYQLDNAPWFVTGVSEGDIVQAVAADDESWPEYVQTMRWSGNCTIRVIPFRQGPLAGDQTAVLDAFTPMGVTGEGAGIYPIVALTITPNLDLRAIKDLLRAGTADGRWEFEEGCVGDAWLAV